jgi:hypothetical protein
LVSSQVLAELFDSIVAFIIWLVVSCFLAVSSKLLIIDCFFSYQLLAFSYYFSLFPIPYSLLPTPYSLFPNFWVAKYVEEYP